MTKADVRQRVRAAIAAIPPEQRRERSASACAAALAAPEFAAARTVMVYLPLADELDCTPLVRAMFDRGVCVAAPRVDWTDRALRPVLLESLEDVESGRHGVSQPTGSRAVALHAIDVVLVPGVAFDELGGRIGRGAGFYDRFLATLPASAVRCGIAFDEQVVTLLPSEPHDVSMHVLMTPTRVLRFRA